MIDDQVEQLLSLYLAMSEAQQRYFDKRHARICIARHVAKTAPSVSKAMAVLQPFDKAHVMECLRGLERYLKAERRKHQRGSAYYRVYTDEIQKVHDLLLALE